MHKSISELTTRMERGFGYIKADMNSMEAAISSRSGEMQSCKSRLRVLNPTEDFTITKWQVHLLFGGSLVASSLLYSCMRYI